jgi:hypothetical protein
MGSGAGHRGPAVPITTPTSRVPRPHHRSSMTGGPRHPAQEERALRSIDVRTRARGLGLSFAGPPRPGRRQAAPRRAGRPRTELWAGDAPEGSETEAGARGAGHGHPAATDALVGTCARDRARALRAGCARSASRTDAERERARTPGRTSLVHARGASNGVHAARGARGVRHDRWHFRRVDPPLRSDHRAVWPARSTERPRRICSPSDCSSRQRHDPRRAPCVAPVPTRGALRSRDAPPSAR